MANKLFAALEELENNVDVNEDVGDLTELEVADAGNQSEVDAIDSEMSEVEQSIEDGEAEAENLEKIEEVVEESVESGEGLDETSAELVQAATEAIMNRLGISTGSVRLMPSMESFGNSSSRLASSKVALENIKSWGAKIMEGIKKVVKYFRDLWFKLVAAVKKLYNNRADYIQGLVNKAKDLKRKGAKIKDDGNKKINLPKELVDITEGGIEKVLGQAAIEVGMAKDPAGEIKQLAQMVDALLDVAKDDAEGKKSKLADLVTKSSAFRDSHKASNTKFNVLDLEVRVEGKKDTFSIFDKTAEAINFSYSTGDGRSGETEEVKPASLDTVIVNLTAAKRILDEYNRLLSDEQAEIEKLSKSIDSKALKAAAGDAEVGGSEKAAGVLKAINFILTQSMKRSRLMSSIVSHVSMRVISVSKMHMAAYEVVKEDKK